MAEAGTIDCQSCGGPYKTKRKNAKLCRVCQLVRDTEYVYGKTQHCLSCDTDFAPLVSRGKPFCGPCTQSGSALYVDGTCRFCGGTEEKLLHEDVLICLVCATDPEQRDTFIVALRKKQRERKAKYGKLAAS